MDGWRSCHGHGEWRYSHVVGIHLGMALWSIPCDGSPSQLASGPTNEHNVITGWVQGPVVAFAWVIVWPGHLDKTFIEGEVVPNGILPALLVLTIVREVLHDVVIDATQCQLPLWAGAYSHHNQGIVGERRFLVLGLLLSRI